jgi:general secretion pathway protein B
MSIIFDALKRAEAERQKSQLPGLSTPVAAEQRHNRRAWALGALFVISGLGAWFLRPANDQSGEPPPRVEVPQAQPAPVSPAAGNPNPPLVNLEGNTQEVLPSIDLQSVQQAVASNPAAQVITPGMPAPSAQPSSMPTLDQPLTQSAQLSPSPPQPNSPQPILPGPPGAEAATPAASVAMPAPSAPIPEPAPAVAAQSQTPGQQIAQAPSQLTPAGLPTVYELEYKIRHELPKMGVSMYVFNANPAFRFVIIGGKKVREGEQVEAKVTVQQIRADGLECDFQGTRFFYPRQAL